MKNTYLIVGAIIVIAIIALTFKSNKTEAPQERGEVTSEDVQNLNLGVLEDGTYELDTTQSKIFWEGEKVIGSKEKGSVLLTSGQFVVENGIPKSGEFVIDMNSIVSDPIIDGLIKHLKSDDFFSVEKYPTAKFVLKTATSTSEAGNREGRYVIAGDLTVKGITKPISFTASVGESQGLLVGVSSFALNRAEWEIKFGSNSFFDNLGVKAFRDAITIGLDLKAKKVIQ